MSDYADTSFLVSFLTPDANSAAAQAALVQTADFLIVTEWHRFEFESALALRRFRGTCSEADVSGWLGAYDAEIISGIFLPVGISFAAVLARARQLVASHSAIVGTRAYDVFHVAAAMELGAARFLTFDGRQAALARAAGLTVLP